MAADCYLANKKSIPMTLSHKNRRNNRDRLGSAWEMFTIPSQTKAKNIGNTWNQTNGTILLFWELWDLHFGLVIKLKNNNNIPLMHLRRNYWIMKDPKIVLLHPKKDFKTWQSLLIFILIKSFTRFDFLVMIEYILSISKIKEWGSRSYKRY